MGGRTCHIGVKTNHLQMLKELGFIVVLYKKETGPIPNIGTQFITKKEYFYNTMRLFTQCCRVKVMVPSSKWLEIDSNISKKWFVGM